jgi:putative transposase
VLPDGTRDILGLWIENTEGAKFWLKVFNDLKTRGCNDLLIAVTDGLKGISEALGAVYPATTLQTCIVHLIRNSLEFANWKERKALATALKPIYTASWRRAWQHVISFFAFPPEVRRVIYSTNSIESVHARLRNITAEWSRAAHDWKQAMNQFAIMYADRFNVRA